MEYTQHTLEQAVEAAQLDDAIRQAPPEKYYIVKMMVEAFINGMATQRELAQDAGRQAGEGR